jgi:hypothetical protein
MKKLVIFAVAVWMAGSAYAAGFEQQMSVNTKDLKVAAAEIASTVATPSYDKASDDNKRVLTCYTSGDGLDGIYVTPQTIEIQTPSGKSYLYRFDHRFYGQTGDPFIMRGANAIDALGGIWHAGLFIVTQWKPSILAVLSINDTVYHLTCEAK